MPRMTIPQAWSSHSGSNWIQPVLRFDLYQLAKCTLRHQPALPVDQVQTAVFCNAGAFYMHGFGVREPQGI
ncbi:hypothetical protein NKDENANG_00610 [Candidatus Entotheonellaceae bacterium PAL068K]